MKSGIIQAFGMHKGKDLDDVPAKYLMWMYKEGAAKGKTLEYIQKNMQGITKQIADGRGDE